MTYCFITAQYLPVPGGVERYTHNLAKELTARGEHAVVVTSARPGLPERETDKDGIEVIRVPGFLALSGRFPVVEAGPAFYRTLDKFLARSDRIVVQTRFYPLSFFSALRCHKQHKKFILIEHGAGHLNIGSPFWNRCGEWYEHFITSVLRSRVPAFYAVSHAGCEWLKHFKIDAKGVLYNFIDLPQIEKETHGVGRNSVRSRYHLPTGRPVVLFTGRLVEEKGVLNLAKAVCLLPEGPDAPVAAFAGFGPLEKELCSSGDRIRVLGNLPQKEIFALLKASDVFCLPSQSEGMSTSMLEAAACGCYIITTACGGNRELISGPEYGTVLPDGSPESIAEALKDILSDPVRRHAAAEAARQKVDKVFTVSSTCDALQNIPWEEL